jgi:predicted amidohydrolase
MERFLAAVVQMASGSDRPANVRRATELVRDGAGRGARLLVLPEVFAWRGPDGSDPAAAEPIPGPTSATMAALARELAVFLCMGSILESVAGDRRSYNTSCLIDPSGAIVARYRKVHLFDVALPGRVAVQESATRIPGDEPVVARTPIATLGCSICYDLRFPELYRELARRGARILTVPAAFTLHTGRDHWHVLLRARAVENLTRAQAPAQWSAKRCSVWLSTRAARGPLNLRQRPWRAPGRGLRAGYRPHRGHRSPQHGRPHAPTHLPGLCPRRFTG